jgi:hypothetical protein
MSSNCMSIVPAMDATFMCSEVTMTSQRSLISVLNVVRFMFALGGRYSLV